LQFLKQKKTQLEVAVRMKVQTQSFQAKQQTMSKKLYSWGVKSSSYEGKWNSLSNSTFINDKRKNAWYA
jgi:hypothetical protein